MAVDQDSTNSGSTTEIIKKRRLLDARVFRRQWQVSNAKKQKGGETSTHEIQGDGKLDTPHPSCEKHRIDNESKTQHGDVEAAKLKQYDLRDPKRSEYPTDHKTKSRYVEYWVPVTLSYVQLEKYCETLIKSRRLLCSSSKDVLECLQQILNTIRKCCDHPYLVDPALENFVFEGRAADDYLSNGIEVSGKFLLLDKVLQEVKRKHLRVLIVFQSGDLKSQSITLQHFLDDLICKKVGSECFVHIYREYDSSQKRAAVNRFNDLESGCLVMLIERCSCQSNIKLSSVDCVIFFNSDLNLSNDIKSLRRMSIQSKFDDVKVFRMYLSYSVEEKVLTLAKEGTALVSDLKNIGFNAIHMLLLWGTLYLFSKLDEFHSHCSSIKDLTCLSDDKLVLDVVNELSGLLSCEYKDDDSCLLIRKAREGDNDYSQNLVLHSEKNEPAIDDDVPPSVIWSSLLEGRNPCWKLIPGSPEKIGRGVGNNVTPVQNVEYSNSGAKMMSKNKSFSEDESSSPRSRTQKVCRPGPSQLHDKADERISCRDDDFGPSKIEEVCVRRMRELLRKQKEEICGFYRAKREDKVKLEEEHQRQVNLVYKKYDEATIKQQELKKLNLIYEQKLERLNSQMDTEKQEMEAEQLASRKNEKQLKDKIFALLKGENLELIKLSLLETPVGQQTVSLVEKLSDPVIVRSNTASLSENEGLQGIDHCTTNAFVQRGDLGIPPDQVLTDRKVLSMESEDGNVGIPLTKSACDSAECDSESSRKSNSEVSRRNATNSGTSAALVCPQRIEEVQNGHCNLEDPTEPFHGESDSRAAVDLVTQKTIEKLQVGDCIMEGPSVASTRVAEMRDERLRSSYPSYSGGKKLVHKAEDCLQFINGKCVLGDSCMLLHSYDYYAMSKRSIKPSQAAVDSRTPDEKGDVLESVTVLPIDVLQTATKPSTPNQNGDALDSTTVQPNDGLKTTTDSSNPDEKGDASDSMTVQSHDCLNMATEPSTSDQKGNASDPVMFQTHDDVNTMTAVLESTEELQDGSSNLEAHLGASDRQVCDIEYTVGASNGEVVMRSSETSDDPGAAANVAVHVEDLLDLPSSRLNGGSKAMMGPQAYSMTGNSSPLEQIVQQPVVSSYVPCTEIRPINGTSGLLNSHTSTVNAPCQPGYTQVPFRDIGMCHQSMVQPQFQSTADQAHPHISSSRSIANGLFQESSLRYNQTSSACTSAFEFELEGIKKREEDLDKFHADEAQNLEFTREKEIQEIRNKYSMLLRESENVLVQKKLELKKFCLKVHANKLLAETLMGNMKRQVSSPMSQEDLLGAMLQICPAQINLPTRTTSVASTATTTTRLLRPQPPVKVHQLSELVTIPPISNFQSHGGHYI